MTAQESVPRSHRTPASTRARLTVMLLALAAVACGSDGVPDLPAGVDPNQAPPAQASADPLAGLPSCAAATPAGASPADVDGLVLPPRTNLETVQRVGPVTEVRGFVPQTPVEVHAFYEARDDVRMLTLEEEGYEAEALYSVPGVRVYVKAKAVCRSGSSILAVVGSGDDPASVPTPAGQGRP